MNLRQIEVFRAVVTTGSISNAAKLLNVSQPAISRLLSHTEQQLGFALFERIKGKLYPTPEAHALYREVEDVYSGVGRIKELAKDLKGKRTGRLRIVSSPSVGHSVLPTAIARFLASNPEVSISAHSLNHKPLIDMLARNRAELGIAITATDHPNLACEAIGFADLVCVCPPDHPLGGNGVLPVADLLDVPMISFGADTPFGALTNALFETSGITPRIAVEVSSPFNACALAKAGAGIAIVDAFSALVAAGPLAILPLDTSVRMNLYLVTLRYEPLSQLGHRFSDLLRPIAREMTERMAQGSAAA
ncbi:MAG: LysR family transcriptional regulator [Acuticoccus sp.]